MGKNRLEQLITLCWSCEDRTEQVRTFLQQNPLSGEALTRAAVALCDKAFLESRDFAWEHGRPPAPEELHTRWWRQLFDLLLESGMAVNAVVPMGTVENYTLLGALYHLDDGTLGAELARKLLLRGADPMLEVDGEKIFPQIDFNIVYDVVEQEDRRLFEIELAYWLVLMGFGGRLSDGRCPVTVQNSCGVEQFRRFEDFGYRIEGCDKHWTMHIFRRDTGEDAALL